LEVKANTAISTGMLIRNIQVQSIHAVIIPPKKAPAVPPAGAAAPHIPMALFISSLLLPNRLMTIAKAEGAVKAAPRPWRALAAIRINPEVANPAITDAIVSIINQLQRSSSILKFLRVYPQVIAMRQIRSRTH
jgi:hypothetical protein